MKAWIYCPVIKQWFYNWLLIVTSKFPQKNPNSIITTTAAWNTVCYGLFLLMITINFSDFWLSVKPCQLNLLISDGRLFWTFLSHLSFSFSSMSCQNVRRSMRWLRMPKRGLKQFRISSWHNRISWIWSSLKSTKKRWDYCCNQVLLLLNEINDPPSFLWDLWNYCLYFFLTVCNPPSNHYSPLISDLLMLFSVTHQITLVGPALCNASLRKSNFWAYQKEQERTSCILLPFDVAPYHPAF